MLLLRACFLLTCLERGPWCAVSIVMVVSGRGDLRSKVLGLMFLLRGLGTFFTTRTDDSKTQLRSFDWPLVKNRVRKVRSFSNSEVFFLRIDNALGRTFQPTKTISPFFLSSYVGYVPASNDLDIICFVWRCEFLSKFLFVTEEKSTFRRKVFGGPRSVGVYRVWSGLCDLRTDHTLPRY